MTTSYFFKPSAATTLSNDDDISVNDEIDYLTAQDIEDIKDVISTLQAEIDSLWPFNKALKQIKVDALKYLLSEKHDDLDTAICETKLFYPRATEGYYFSTRTKDLLERLEFEHDNKNTNN